MIWLLQTLHRRFWPHSLFEWALTLVCWAMVILYRLVR